MLVKSNFFKLPENNYIFILPLPFYFTFSPMYVSLCIIHSLCILSIAQYTPTVVCTGNIHTNIAHMHLLHACPHKDTPLLLYLPQFGLDVMATAYVHHTLCIGGVSNGHRTVCTYARTGQSSRTHTWACVPHTVWNMLTHLDSAEKESGKSSMADRIIVTLVTD